MGKPNPGQSRGNVSSRTKEYSGNVNALPNGVKTFGGTKGTMNTAPKASTTAGQKGKAA